MRTTIVVLNRKTGKVMETWGATDEITILINTYDEPKAT